LEGDLLVESNVAVEESISQRPGSLALLAFLGRPAGGESSRLDFFPLSAIAPAAPEPGGFTTKRGLVTTPEAPVGAVLAGVGAVEGAAGTLYRGTTSSAASSSLR